MFPQLEHFTDFALVFLRLMVGLIFVDSGYNDLKGADARSRTSDCRGASRFSWERRSYLAELRSSSVC